MSGMITTIVLRQKKQKNCYERQCGLDQSPFLGTWGAHYQCEIITFSSIKLIFICF